jgi:orotidine-5'-phosphate decarboxylase
MYVIGATRPELLVGIRQIIPDHFLLIPGVGTQGGSIQSVCKFGLNKQVGLIINVSRGIIYASNENDFHLKAGEEAKNLQRQMAEILHKKQ